MAPFGIHFGKKKKQPTGVAQEIIHEDPYGEREYSNYALEGDGHHGSQIVMTTQQPAPKPSRWKSVLRRKQQQPVVEQIVAPHDRRFLDSDYELQPQTISGPHTTGQHTTPAITVLPVPPGGSVVHGGYEPTVMGHHRQHYGESDSSSGSEDGRRSGLQRHNTGHSHTIGPHDSASNVHYVVPQHGGHVLTGIVEEQSDVDYERRSGSPVIQALHRPVQAPVIISAPSTQHDYPTSHSIGHGLTIHQGGEHRDTSRLPPLEVTDAHGRRQKVQEVLLDGSGMQEIPMPADGNVIFIVEEGVTLDVKDPETGEFIPLEEYYARLAARAPPKPQERYIVVNGDASNIIVEDADGQVLHRGSRVTSEYIRNRVHPTNTGDSERSHSRSQRSHRSHRRVGSGHSEQYSQHIIDRKGRQITVTHSHPDPQLRLYFADPKSPGGRRPHQDHLVITPPPSNHKGYFQTTPQIQIQQPSRAHTPNSRRSSTSSSRSRQSSDSATNPPRPIVQGASEFDTTPEASVIGSKPLEGHEGLGRQWHANGSFDGAGAGTPGVYLASIPEGSREFLPGGQKMPLGSIRSGKTGASSQIMGMPSPQYGSGVVKPGSLPAMTPHGEVSQLPGTPIISMPSPNRSMNYNFSAANTPHTGKAPSISGQSMYQGGSVQQHMTDGRASNAVSFADNALIINGDGTPAVGMMDHQGEVVMLPEEAEQPQVLVTPRSSKPGSLRSNKPSIKSIKSTRSIPQSAMRTPSVRSMAPPPAGSPVVSMRNVGHMEPTQELPEPTTIVPLPDGAVDLSSPPPTAGFVVPQGTGWSFNAGGNGGADPYSYDGPPSRQPSVRTNRSGAYPEYNPPPAPGGADLVASPVASHKDFMSAAGNSRAPSRQGSLRSNSHSRPQSPLYEAPGAPPGGFGWGTPAAQPISMPSPEPPAPVILLPEPTPAPPAPIAPQSTGRMSLAQRLMGTFVGGPAPSAPPTPSDERADGASVHGSLSSSRKRSTNQWMQDPLSTPAEEEPEQAQDLLDGIGEDDENEPLGGRFEKEKPEKTEKKGGKGGAKGGKKKGKK